MNTHPDWAAVGSKAFVIESRGRHSALTEVTVTRTTATLIIASIDGPGGAYERRFKANTSGIYREVGHSSSYYAAPSIVAHDSPIVAAVLEDMRQTAIRNAAIDAASAFSSSPSTLRAERAIEALRAYLTPAAEAEAVLG